MKHTLSESDVTSIATMSSSPPRTPTTTIKTLPPKQQLQQQRPAYYVQLSPSSRDSSHSHDDADKCTSTPVYNNSPLESPSHPSTSTGRHSRISSSSAAARYSGYLRSSSYSSPRGGGGRNNKRLTTRGWREVAIDEESYDDEEVEEEEERDELPSSSRFCVLAFWLSVLVLVFTLLCLIVWGVARNYEPTVIVKSLRVHNFYVGEGSDLTGVPTKLATLNCTLNMNVHNPSTMFGIHVSSTYARLMYSEISIAHGQFEEFYQPRTSRRVASAVLHGEKTPLYGAGATLDYSNSGAGGGAAVPLTLELGVRTRGYVIGKLVRVSHAKHVTCPVVVSSNKPVSSFRQSACTYT